MYVKEIYELNQHDLEYIVTEYIKSKVNLKEIDSRPTISVNDPDVEGIIEGNITDLSIVIKVITKSKVKV